MKTSRKAIVVLIAALSSLLFLAPWAEAATIPTWTPSVGYVGGTPYDHNCRVIGNDQTSREAVECSGLLVVANHGAINVYSQSSIVCQTNSAPYTEYRCAGASPKTFAAQATSGDATTTATWASSCGNPYGGNACPRPPARVTTTSVDFIPLRNGCGEFWAVSTFAEVRLPESGQVFGPFNNFGSHHVRLCTPA